MKRTDTKQRILTEALKLFAAEGYEAVSVERIAETVGIKAPSLYKHFRSKRDIFDSILREMERRDTENAEQFSLPTEAMETDPQAYEGVPIGTFMDFCRKMFRYWTEDEFASAFRRMLTVEQYRSAEMNALYHQYLGAGPLQYTADLLGSAEAALTLYGPMHLLYGMADRPEGRDLALQMLDSCLETWRRLYQADAGSAEERGGEENEVSAE